MNTHIRTIIASVAIGMILIGPSIALGADPTAIISVIPSSGTYQVGDTITVDLKLDTGGAPSATLGVRVEYSSNTLEFVSVDGANSDFPAPVTNPIPSENPFYLARARFDAGFTGANGQILRINFRATSLGQATVTINTSTVGCGNKCTEVIHAIDFSDILLRVNNASFTIAEPSCGNGQIDPGETCISCPTDVQCTGGTQCCGNGTCQVLCGGDVCGDGLVTGTEACDTADPNSCTAPLTCAADCSACVTESLCGNGRIDPQEHCDASFPPSDRGPIPGASGTWECSANTCELVFSCGNGIEELGEQCQPGDQFCNIACEIDACGILRLSDPTSFIGRYSNLPSWRYGMDDLSTNGPADPRSDQFLWFSDVYIKKVQQELLPLEFVAPFNGSNDGYPGDPAHHSARWSGTVTVPVDGFYSYLWGSRDDAWILFDGVISDSVRGLQSTVGLRQSSIFLTEGTHIVEIYYVSRQGTIGNEGTFFFRFENAGLPTAPYLPGCSYCGNGIREAGEVCDDGFKNGQGTGVCNTMCTGLGTSECGNSITETGEECDDGKHCANGAACQNASDCADFSECIPRAGDGCDAQCLLEPVCGNGVPEGDEECDDGNLVSGDGCSDTCTLETICGDGVKEGAEQCDDGNTVPGDGCSDTCQLELVSCGNAILEPNLGEQCDAGGLCTGGIQDGNTCTTPLEALDCALAGGDCIAQTGDGDDCDANCQLDLPIVCGDGRREGNEQCDFGTCSEPPPGGLPCNDDSSPDMCRTDCLLPFCGDNVQDSGEQCDTGDNRSDLLPDRCRLDCRLPRCGDAIIDTGEECDQGTLNHDTIPNRCRTDCRNPVCGDGITDTQHGEECDDGNTVDDDGCSATCLAELPVCGNGRVETGEQCDDANTNEDDTCSAQCQLTVCGDNVVQNPNGLDQNEECDDGNASNTDSCSNACALAICGDDILQPLGRDGAAGGNDDEQCDDGTACPNGSSCSSDDDCIVQTGEVGSDGAVEINGELVPLPDLNGAPLCIPRDNDGCSASCQIEIGPNCGDGIVHIEEGEECDDANTDNTDACTTACRFAACGDNHVQPLGRDGQVGGSDDERCDDGNTLDGDGCSALCQPEVVECGNGIVEPGEQCDDGNAVSTDACSDQCEFTVCGDGLVQNPNGLGFSEECDDGNSIGTDDCTNVCLNAACGDGILHIGTEECDDGNVSDEDACSSSCEPTRCGDGTTQSPNGFGLQEECDDGNTSNNDSCTNLCASSACGDGILFSGVEQCDDGNLVSGDGCSALCVIEDGGGGPGPGPIAQCGNGAIEGNEQCDDGNTTSHDGCSSSCRLEIECGNGLREIGEECDDGNLRIGDGCNRRCELEELCGNGTINTGEECDDGNTRSNDGCSFECKTEEVLTGCGNGILDPGEQCDAGTGNSDVLPQACRTDCTRSRCGDGAIDSGEQCDEGEFNNNTSSDSCRTNCRAPFCGDNVLDHRRGERCDDGNNRSGDGCSSSCLQETATVAPVPTPGQGPPRFVAPEPPVVTPPRPQPFVPVYNQVTAPTFASVASLLSSIDDGTALPDLEQEPYPEEEVVHPAPRTPGTGPRTLFILSALLAGMFVLRRRKWLKMFK